MNTWFAIATAHAASLNLSLSSNDQTTVANGDPNAAVGVVLNHVGQILITLALPLAIAAILFAGYRILNGAGDTKAYDAAKSILLWVFMGSFFVLGATLIVGTIYRFFA